jgi:sulfur carrier protein ThiS
VGGGDDGTVVKLRLGGYLSFFLPGFPTQVEVSIVEPTRLGEILKRLGIPFGEIYLVVLNGGIVDPDTTLISPNDEVRIFSAVDGG